MRVYHLSFITLLISQYCVSHNLTVLIYDQRSKPLASCQVKVATSFGHEYGVTDSIGKLLLDDVSGVTKIIVAKEGYLGAARDSFNVLSDTVFNGVLFDSIQYRIGMNGIGIDTVGIYSEEWKSVFGVDASRTRLNPRLFDVQNFWPNYNIPVDAQGFSVSDSTKIWSYLNHLNDYFGKTLFIPGKVDPATTRGIIARPTQTNSNYTDNSSLNGYIKYSLSNLTSSLSEWVVQHEIAYHGLIYVSGHGTNYSPTNFNTAGQTYLPKDAVYMNLGYLLQHLRQTGKSGFVMYDYHDSVQVDHRTTNRPPSKPRLEMPLNGETYNSRTNEISLLWWSAIPDSDYDRLTYTVKVKGPRDTSFSTRQSSFNIPPNTLVKGKYQWFIQASDNIISTTSDTSGFSVKNTAPSKVTIEKSIVDTVKNKVAPFSVSFSRSLDADNDTITYIIHINDTSIVSKDTNVAFPLSYLIPNSVYSIHVASTDGTDTTQSTNSISFRTASTLLGISENPIPNHFELYQNYPNPYNPITCIQYDLSHKGFTALTIYNSLGQKVAALVNIIQEPGHYSVSFDGTKLSSGVYLYTISSGSFTQTKRMMLVK